jgi:3-hydroxyacyl-[acyl-carrier-protein] dehydratase
VIPAPDLPGILAALPVRPPMLLVDRVLELVPGQRIVAAKAISCAEPCYVGVAEGRLRDAAYPSALALESFGQAAALLRDCSLPPGERGVRMLGAFRDCRVTGRALPGDVLVHTVRLDQLVHGHAFVHGESRVGDRLVLQVGSLIAVQRPRAEVDRPGAAGVGVSIPRPGGGA